jgi:hypothetical protein
MLVCRRVSLRFESRLPAKHDKHSIVQGRGAVYYCMQSPSFAPVYLSRLRRQPWYTLRDTLDLTPVHFVVLRGVAEPETIGDSAGQVSFERIQPRYRKNSRCVYNNPRSDTRTLCLWLHLVFKANAPPFYQ